MKKVIATVIAITAITTAVHIPRAHADSYWAEGLGIGAATGGIGLGLAAALGGSCTGDLPGHDSDDCAGLSVIAGFGVGFLGALVGGIVGAGIGACIEKEPKVTIAPTISPGQNGNTTYGLGIQGSF